MPFALSTWLLGLLALALFGGGVYFVWAWALGVLVGTAYLLYGIGMLLVSLFGRFIVLGLLRRPGPDEPDFARGGEMRRIDRPDGTGLQVERYGREGAPILLFTHGWGTNSTAWYYAKRHLADRFQLVVWDLPGLGRSRAPSNADYSLEKMARDLEAVLTSLGDQPVVLVGHSIGGMISQTFCRLFPHHLGTRVHGLVLVDTTHTKPTRTTMASGLVRLLEKPIFVPLLYLTILLSPFVRLMNWLSYLNGSSHLFSMVMSFAGTETRGQLDVATRYTPLASPAVLSRGMLGMLGFEETATLPTISVPTLVAVGDNDRVTVPEASETIVRNIPSAALVSLSPGGHMAVFERHDQLIPAIAAFASEYLVVPAAPSSHLRETA